MTVTTHADILAAVVAFVKSALPRSKVVQNQPKPQALPCDGLINVLDGTVEDLGADLSPLRYNWRRSIPLVLLTPDDPQAHITALGAALDSDRFLGGLAEWMDAQPPEPEFDDVTGAEPMGQVLIVLVVEYTTANPLG